MILRRYLFQKLISQIKDNKSDIDLVIDQYTNLVEVAKEMSKIPECSSLTEKMVLELSNMKKTIKSLLYKTDYLVDTYKDIIQNN